MLKIREIRKKKKRINNENIRFLITIITIALARNIPVACGGCASATLIFSALILYIFYNLFTLSAGTIVSSAFGNFLTRGSPSAILSMVIATAATSE